MGLSPGARIFIGEVHGTVETPAFVAELARAAVPPVRVVLELPADEDVRIAAFMASGDPRDLVAGPFWTDSFQCGRRSVAMVELIDAVRKLERAAVVTFDAWDDDRDQAMARRLEAAVRREPDATFIALAGNVHAQKTPGFMAHWLAEWGVPFVSLNAGGLPVGSTAWVCMEDGCGIRDLGFGPGHPMGIVLAPVDDGAYDGTVGFGVAHASPPAYLAMT